MRRVASFTKWIVLFALVAAALGYGRQTVMADWWAASREPTGIAPSPADHPAALVQVYGARTYGWRGVFGVHTWIAVKPENASNYTVYEVIGWRLYSGGSSVVVSNRAPDGRWYGAAPDLIAQARGPEAEAMMERIKAAVLSYPYADRYTAYPGPNSNTFVAHVARAVPELRVDLPPTAIGKDYLPESLAATTPSGTGVQANLFGLLGVMVGYEEGVEVNVLGLTFGIDPLDLALKLPMVGRLGLTSQVAADPVQP